MPPDISVIIPCYKQAHYLAGCIQSVLGQAGPAAEIIVIDDGSPDDVAGAAGRFPQVCYVRQNNAGLAAARNAGLALATGEFVVFLDADDRLADAALACHRSTARSRPDASVFCGGWREFDDAGKTLAEYTAPAFTALPLKSLLPENPAPPVCYLLRRSAVDAIGRFGDDPQLFGHEDWDLWLRLAAAGHAFVNVSQVVGLYRRSSQSMTTYGNDRMMQSGLYLLRRWRKCGPDRDSRKRATRGLNSRMRVYAWRRLAAGQRREALGAYSSRWLGQVGEGQIKFLVALPIMATLPHAWALRLLPGSGKYAR